MNQVPPSSFHQSSSPYTQQPQHYDPASQWPYANQTLVRPKPRQPKPNLATWLTLFIGLALTIFCFIMAVNV